MADDYIDNTETLVYGPRCVDAVLRALEGPLAEQPAEARNHLRWCAAQLAAANDAMRAALNTASASGDAQQDQARSTAAARANARRAIRGLYKHLDAALENESWDGDPARYLPGGLRSVPVGGRALLAMLDALRDKLRADDSVPAQRDFLKRLGDAHRALSAAVTHGDAANAGARDELSEQSAVKLDWLRVYRATALAIESALVLANRGELLPQLVPHLAAPGSPKPAPPASPTS